MTCRPFGPHTLMGDPYRPAGCTCGTLANPHGGTMDTALHYMPDPPGQSLTEMVHSGPNFEKGPDTTMTTAAHPAAPERIDATRANALAIEGAYKIRETQARLLELARLVGPAIEAASLLRNEIRLIEAAIKDREGQQKMDVAEAKGADGKKLYTNETARQAALADIQAKDGEYQLLLSSLNDKRAALAKAEADSTAITTEIGALKSVAQLASAALNALGLAAVQP